MPLLIVLLLVLAIIGLIVELITKVWLYILLFVLSIVGAILLYKLFWYLLESFYFNSSNFKNLKSSLQNNIQECNDLNMHIENLKTTFLSIGRTDYGEAVYQDKSQWRYTRSALESLTYCNRTYDCSASVCKHAQEQPFKYFCKYFNVPVDEETLINFECVLNNFSSAEQGKKLLLEEREKLISNVKNHIPFLLYTFRKQKLFDKLGFDSVVVNDVHFPKYTFRYVSAAGKSKYSWNIVFDINTLERFIRYLAGIIKFRKSVAGQRALMTTTLRDKIKRRDNFTCQCCGISVHDEPHILLEIDHIKPLSKGGLTTEDNLQTLCWKCNRSKSNRLAFDAEEVKKNNVLSSIYETDIVNVLARNDDVVTDAPVTTESKVQGNICIKPLDNATDVLPNTVKGDGNKTVKERSRKRIGMMIGTIFLGFYAFLFGVGCIVDVVGTIYYQRARPIMLPMLALVIAFSILSYMFGKLANSSRGDTHIGDIKKSRFVLICLGISILSMIILLAVLNWIVKCMG